MDDRLPLHPSGSRLTLCLTVCDLVVLCDLCQIPGTLYFRFVFGDLRLTLVGLEVDFLLRLYRQKGSAPRLLAPSGCLRLLISSLISTKSVHVVQSDLPEGFDWSRY